MVIKEISPGQKVPCGNEGALIFVGDGENLVMIDAAERQSDQEEVIDIYQDDMGTLVEGEKNLWYAATIVIPPRQYHMVDTGQVGDQDQPVFERESLPVDMDAVTVVLWPLNKLLNEGGEN